MIRHFTVYVFLLDDYRGKKLHPSLPVLKIGYTRGVDPYLRIRTNAEREGSLSYESLFGKIECLYSKTFNTLKDAKMFEKELLRSLAKKDLYIEEKISGVTELRVALDWRINVLNSKFGIL